MCCFVQFNTSACQHIFLFSVTGSSKDCLYSGNQNLWTEGFGNILIHSQVEAHQFIPFITFCCQHNDRNPGVCANLTTYLPSVHLWHHDIQNNQSDVFLFKKYIYRLFSVTGFQHIKIFFHQEIFYQFPHSALVIHNQNLQFSHSCSSS